MGRRTHFHLKIAALLIFLASSAYSQPPVLTSLRDAASRSLPDYQPRMLGQSVTVRGIVTAPLLEAPDAVYLSIVDTDKQESGLMLIFDGDNIGAQPAKDVMKSGLLVEAQGVVALHAGQAVVKPASIRVQGHVAAIAPPVLTPLESASFKYEGRLVVIEGTVGEYREAPSGDLLEFIEGGPRVFLPVAKRSAGRPLFNFHSGDRVRVRGLLSQFCPSPPYDRFFQLLLSHPKDISLIETRPMVPPQVVPLAVLLILLAILSTWYLQQRATQRSNVVQRILQASEDLYGNASARELADILRLRLLELLPADSVGVYHFDPARKVAERIPDQTAAGPHSFNIEECATASERGIALAIRNKAILQFMDMRSAEILRGLPSEPRALLVIPMRKRDESIGALVILGKPGKTLLHRALYPAAQHLANDASQYFDLLEQTSLREQIHRSEKLAVAGQLIHGVISELSVPLENLRMLTVNLPPADQAAVRQEIERASETVRRIVSVARAEQIDARPIELRAVFQKLFDDMQGDLEKAGLASESFLPPEPIYVVGSQEQLRTVFQNLLLHSVAAATHSLERTLGLNVSRIGRSAMIEIEFSGPFGDGDGPDFSASALSMAISRGLLQSHGGEMRFTTIRAGRYRYEVELPSMSASPNDDFAQLMDVSLQRGQITALLVEPETQSQRRLLAIFGELNHRLIPVSNIEEAADLAEKVRFDVVFSSVRPEGGTWSELFHRVHHRTPHFALLSESAEALTPDEQRDALLDTAASSVLRKPVEHSDILNLLNRLQQNSLVVR